MAVVGAGLTTSAFFSFATVDTPPASADTYCLNATNAFVPCPSTPSVPGSAPTTEAPPAATTPATQPTLLPSKSTRYVNYNGVRPHDPFLPVEVSIIAVGAVLFVLMILLVGFRLRSFARRRHMS